MSVPITPGSGLNVASDLVGGLHYQEIKWVLGPTGVVVPVSVGAGNVDTGTPRFALASNDALHAKFDSLEAKIDDLNTRIGGNTDALVDDAATDASVLTRLRGTQSIHALQYALDLALSLNTDPAQVVSPGTVLDVVLTLNTVSAYAPNDILADLQVVTGAFRFNGGSLTIDTIHVLDEDNQAATFDLICADAAVSLGAENSAPNISDISARSIIAEGGPAISPPNPLRILASDYTDLGLNKVQTKTGVGLKLKAATGSTSLWIGAITRGTPTHTVNGIRLKIGVSWD